ncbi:MAG: dihydroneopterin triphosphate diphosphatase [Burkholderiales bacterium]|nr:dihydroneopterin triphosphate diphosphatase [Burkholderiales bacterium]
MSKPYKIPQSVLVVIYTPQRYVLLIRRADGQGDTLDFWQSVTGSKDAPDEALVDTAVREVWEETGIDCAPGSRYGRTLHDWHLENVYTIYPQWLHRYAPGVTHNREHLFGLQVEPGCPVRLNPREHTDYQWLPCHEAAQRCFSPSNAEAILLLERFAQADLVATGAPP